MKLKATGKGDELPELKKGQHIFVDMWGNWHHYDSGFSPVDKRFNDYIEMRQRSVSYFNINYIRMYKSL